MSSTLQVSPSKEEIERNLRANRIGPQAGYSILIRDITPDHDINGEELFEFFRELGISDFHNPVTDVNGSPLIRSSCGTPGCQYDPRINLYPARVIPGLTQPLEIIPAYMIISAFFGRGRDLDQTHMSMLLETYERIARTLMSYGMSYKVEI